METGSKDKKQISKNPALYCCICQRSTEELERAEVSCVRVDDQIINKTVTFCSLCVSDLSTRFEKEEHIPQQHKTSRIHPVTKGLTPVDIYAILDKTVMGQTSAKKIISSAVATHLKRIDNLEIEKSNILLLGPTGSGKTEMARTLAKNLEIPLVIADATTLTAHGFVGEDVESILLQLLYAAGNDVSKAEKGIVFIDEIDKLAKSANDGDVGTGKVQQALLKMIEGGKVKLPKPNISKRNGESEYIFIDTSKILFICAGAFPALEEKLFERQIGISATFETSTEKTFKNISVEEIRRFGIIPELLGRLPVICHTEKLLAKDFYNILTIPKNSIPNQFIKLMKTYGIILEFDKSFLTKISEEAAALEIGARGLRSLMEKHLQEVIFEGPSKDCNHIKVKAKKIEYLKTNIHSSDLSEIIENKRKREE